jgi:hypothetical protein
MNKKILKLALIALTTVVVMFSSCSKDNVINTLKPPIIAVVENGNTYDIDSVALELNQGIDIINPLATVPYENGKFQFSLLTDVIDEYLDNAQDIAELYERLLGRKVLNVSNEKAKYSEVFIYAYKDDKKIGEFILKSDDWVGHLVYANDSVSLLGKWTNNILNDIFQISTFEVNFLKGWNILWNKENKIENTITFDCYTDILEPNPKWYFEILE